GCDAGRDAKAPSSPGKKIVHASGSPLSESARDQLTARRGGASVAAGFPAPAAGRTAWAHRSPAGGSECGGACLRLRPERSPMAFDFACPGCPPHLYALLRFESEVARSGYAVMKEWLTVLTDRCVISIAAAATRSPASANRAD